MADEGFRGLDGHFAAPKTGQSLDILETGVMGRKPQLRLMAGVRAEFLLQVRAADINIGIEMHRRDVPPELR